MAKNFEVSTEQYDYTVEVGYMKFKFGIAGAAINFARDAVSRQVSKKPDEVRILITKKVTAQEPAESEVTE